MLNIYLTNLGLYNEGILAGEWVKLPATDEEIDAVKARTGYDSTHEEYFITDYETDVHGLHVGEYESIDELNRLAALIEQDVEAVEVLLSFGYDTADEIAAHIEDVCYITTAEGLETEEAAVGYYFVNELGALEVPEHLQPYFDFEAYGRDIMLDGRFYRTKSGAIYEVAA